MRNSWAFAWGSLVGILGGLIGLGGAEFRLPILVSIFNYSTLPAIIINLLVSFVTVTFSFMFRSGIIGLNNVLAHSSIVLNILAGSLMGSYLGVQYASRINERNLNKIVVIFLIFLSFILISHDLITGFYAGDLPGILKIILAFLAGIVIGIFSSMLGVAGGELIIPTIIFIFGVEIKLAGSLSLAISIPTILMGLYKYRTKKQFKSIKTEQNFILYMSLGSILGALIGSHLLRYISPPFLHLILGTILLISAFKLARHET